MVAGERVPTVRSTGPMPKIPSTPEKPLEVLATPIDWLGITKPEAMVTWSRYSVPENDPEPYVTETELEVLTLVLVLTYAFPAPTQVFELPVSTMSE